MFHVKQIMRIDLSIPSRVTKVHEEAKDQLELLDHQDQLDKLASQVKMEPKEKG